MPGLPPEEKVRLLGRTVRRLRRERDLSQEALAAAGDVHISQVGRLERGDSDVYASTLLRVADGLGMPLSELVRSYEEQLLEP